MVKKNQSEGPVPNPSHAVKSLGGVSELTPVNTHIIAFLNFKGGVGKTTCAVNVASCLAKQFNKKVLLIDLDVQASLSQWLMGGEIWEKWTKHRKKTSYQIFLDVINGSHAWDWEASTWRPEWMPGLRLCPATYDMLQLDTQLLFALNKSVHINPVQCLDVRVKPISGFFDYVIFDCPPNVYLTTQNALFCADYVLIPTVADFLSMTGLPRLVGFLQDSQDRFLLLDRAPAKVLGLIPTMHNDRMIDMKEGQERLRKDVLEYRTTKEVFSKKAQVFPRIRRLSAPVAKAQKLHLPVTEVDASSEISHDFIGLTQAILGVLS